MSTDIKKGTKSSKTKSPSPDEVYNGFQSLRSEQRALLSKLSEVELDLNEHKIVLDTLKDLEGERKCFRLIGGILCEKTVKDVLPALSQNKEQLTLLAEVLNEQVTKKGIEINEYKEKHNIKIRGQDDLVASNDPEPVDPKPNDTGPRNAITVNPI